MDEYGPGVVAVSADEAGRYTQFAMSMQGLLLPSGTRTVWQIGNDIAGNRNRAVEALLDSEQSWLWFIDDDHAFSPRLLLSLLEHGEDIVAPVVLRRQQPFQPVACALDGDHLDLGRCSSEGLVEVEHTGSAGMLIRREVLEAVEAPWFELGNGISEDVNFCRAAREQGFNVFVDLGLRMGHITTCAVWPAWDDEQGRWLTGFTVGDGFNLATDACVAAVGEV